MGMYHNIISQEEIQRLRGFAYPQAITEKLLNDYQPESGEWGLLDIDCGSNPALAMYTNRRDGYYFGLDINEQMLGALQEALWKKSSNYTLLPYDVADRGLEIFNDGTFDVVHMRFALIHIPDVDKRVRIMKEAVRVARRRVLFLEWDWSTFRFSNSDTAKVLNLPPQEQAMFTFLMRSMELAEYTNTDLYAGKVLPYFTINSGFTYAADQRPFGDYTDEMIGLCRMEAAAMRKWSLPALADRNAEPFEFLIRKLPDLRAMCQPPAICIAELCK